MLSEETKQKLDEALLACAGEGVTIFGAFVNEDCSEMQTFNNGSDNMQAWLHNMKTVTAAIEESLTNKHEA